jgi:hypothetical protein
MKSLPSRSEPKGKTMLWKLLVILSLLVVPAIAATITISDLEEAPPIVGVTGLGSVDITLAHESAIISATFFPAGVEELIAVGTRSVIFTEPPDDPFGPRLSDFLTIVVGPPRILGEGAPFQDILVVFKSDGSAGFDTDIASLDPSTPTILEDGTMQDLTALLNTNALSIAAQSDIGFETDAPEPSSLLLLSGGLLAVLSLRRRLS